MEQDGVARIDPVQPRRENTLRQRRYYRVVRQLNIYFQVLNQMDNITRYQIIAVTALSFLLVLSVAVRLAVAAV